MSAPIDLDALLPDAKPVTLGGVQYQIPKDMPLVTFLKVNEVNEAQGQEDSDAVAVLREMVEALVELFAWHLPEGDAEVRATIRTELFKRDMEFIAQLLTTLYPGEAEEAGVEAPDGEGEADAPPTPTTPGTTTT